MATLFTTEEPVSRDSADGTDSYSMGTYFTPAVDGTVSAIRWWFPQSGQPGGVAPKANLFRTSDSATLGGADAVFAYPGTPDGWNQVALSTPVAISAGVEYCAAIWTPNRYVNSNGGASPWPLTNGDLSTPSDAGRFASGASGNVDFPASSFNNGCYFVDVVFSADGDPAEGTAATTIDLAVSGTGARASAGAGALGLGLAVAATGARASSAVAALGLGLAPAATGARPSLGSVALSLNLDVSGSGLRAASGTAALGLNLAVSATGVRPYSGEVALGLNLAVSATGSNGQSGRPVKPWPGTVVPVSSYPWTPRPVRSFQEVNQP